MNPAVTFSESDFWALLTQTPVSLDKFSNRKVEVPPNASSLYLLEFLIADTLALLDTQCTWFVSGVGPDGGVDFEAHTAIVRINLFELEIRSTLLGQIKRMKQFSDDRLRSAMSKFHDLRKNMIVSAVLFVISSSDESEAIKNRVINQREYCDYLNLPRHYLDVDSFFELWAARKDYLRGVLANTLPEPQASFVADTILQMGRRRLTALPLRVAAKLLAHTVNARTPFLIRLTVEFSRFLSLQTIRLRHQASPLAEDAVIVLRPSMLGNPEGAEFRFRNTQHVQIDVWMRANFAGEFNLGKIFVWESGSDDEPASIELGQIKVMPHFVPLYLPEPNQVAHSQLERLLRDIKGGMVKTAFVVGAGGAGKTEFCNHMLDYALAGGFNSVRQAVSDTADQRADLATLICQLYGTNGSVGVPLTENVLTAVQMLIGDQQAILMQVKGCLDESDLAIQPRELSIALCALAVRRLHDGPILIHIQDMHWATKPLLDTLSFLIAGLSNAAKADGVIDALPNGVLFLLEGREGESRSIRGNHLSIQPWLDFRATTDAVTITLKPWDEKDSRFLIERLIPLSVQENEVANIERELWQEVVNYVYARGRGSPMHMVEQVRLLFDDGTLDYHSSGSLILRAGLRNKRPVPDDVDEVIRDRWRYLQSTAPQTAEILVLLAKTGRTNPRGYVDHLLTSCRPALTPADLERSGCIEFPGEHETFYQFMHENYVQAFHELPIDGRSALLGQAIAWHQAHSVGVPRTKLNQVRLMLLRWRPPYGKALRLASQVLVETSMQGVQSELRCEALRSLMLLPREHLYNTGMLPERLHLQLAKCLAGTTGWEDSLAELVRLEQHCALAPNDHAISLVWAEALAEKSNLLVDLQRTDNALEAVVKGMRLLDKLRTVGVTPALSEQLDALEDKFLHRQAVALWFDGRHEPALRLQRAAMRRARIRGDDASLSVILREHGTLRLHTNPLRGQLLLREAVRKSEACTGMDLVDRRVSEVQALMADLLVAAVTGGTVTEFERISSSAMHLHQTCRLEGFAYEPALAAQIAGCAAVAAGDDKRAQRFFELAVLHGTLSSLPHLTWQSQLNLAQLNHECGSSNKSALTYASHAVDVIRKGLDDPRVSTARRQLMMLPLRQARRCGAADKDGWLAALTEEGVPLCERIAPLHYRRGESTFFLMC